jgi:hypothetical protein
MITLVNQLDCRWKLCFRALQQRLVSVPSAPSLCLGNLSRATAWTTSRAGPALTVVPPIVNVEIAWEHELEAAYSTASIDVRLSSNSDEKSGRCLTSEMGRKPTRRSEWQQRYQR